MTNEEILQQIYDETLVGNKPAVVELTARGIEAEIPPNTLLFEALIPALEEVGARFERGDFFVPGDADLRSGDDGCARVAAPVADRFRCRRRSAPS